MSQSRITLFFSLRSSLIFVVNCLGIVTILSNIMFSGLFIGSSHAQTVKVKPSVRGVSVVAHKIVP